MTANDPERFIKKAKLAVREAAKLDRDIYDEVTHLDQLYVVWFAKTLQNWKALVSTDVVNGVYYEVTHNGEKGETYVDSYRKFKNTVIPDDAPIFN